MRQLPLVKVDQEHDVVPEARHAMRGGHCDDERKEVVDESVECLVHESAPEMKLRNKIKYLFRMRLYVPGKVGNGLQLVVEEELRQHEEETKGINPIHSCLQQKKSQTLMKLCLISDQTWIVQEYQDL